MNDGLKRIFGEYFVVHCQSSETIVTIADESSGIQPNIIATLPDVFIFFDSNFYRWRYGIFRSKKTWLPHGVLGACFPKRNGQHIVTLKGSLGQ